MSAKRSRSKRRPQKRGRAFSQAHYATGIIDMSKRGFGFVEAEGGTYYIREKDINGAMHGDKVEVRKVASDGESWGGRVSRILERAHSVIIGQFELFGELGVVIPFDKRIAFDAIVEKERFGAANPGDIVVGTIVAYPTRKQALVISIDKVLGEADKPGIEQEIVELEFGLRNSFPKDCLDQCESLKIDVAKELSGNAARRDIRSRCVFTVDPKDAKDFDDALSVEISESGYILGIHIADVSHFFAQDSPLDCEARARSASAYFADRVIPMLPEKLSNDLCSLRGGVDRMAMTVDISLDHDCKVVSAEMYRSIICSRARLNYDEVQSFFDSQAQDKNSERLRANPIFDKEICVTLEALLEIGRMRAEIRMSQGALDFETRVPRFLFDADKNVQDIEVCSKTQATSMVEEAMILANEIVAVQLTQRGIPCAYRIHEKPDADALDSLRVCLKELGYRTGHASEVDSFTYQRMLASAHGRREEYFVNSLLIRSLMPAKYSEIARPHFGLASNLYCHFTSPIRRYPDIIVHRLLGLLIDECGGCSVYTEGEKPKQIKQSLRITQQYLDEVRNSCLMSNENIRNIEKAERESVKVELCKYLSRFLGCEYSGIISGVTTFGFFVTLDNTAEGLMPVRHLEKDVWSYDSIKYELSGQNSNTTYKIGMKVTVIVEQVDVRERKIDFRPV